MDPTAQQAPSEHGAVPLEAAIFHHPARLTGLIRPEQRASYDTLLGKARTAVPDPSIFDEREPFFWSAVASNSQTDAYSTRMADSSLRNYARDAQAGVAFMNSHRTGGLASDAELPLGQTISGTFRRAAGEGAQAEPARVLVEAYTLRGYAPNGSDSITSDVFLDGLRAGLIRDVSIGFYGGSYRCALSFCGRSWLDCPHWPGFEYDVPDKDGRATGEREVATVWIENARLAEVSAVYDGATPGAVILEVKASRAAEAGELPAKTARLLEARYRLALPGARTVVAGADLTPTPPEGGDMDPLDGRQTPDPPEPSPDDPRPTQPAIEAQEGRILAADEFALAETVRQRAGAPEGATVRWLCDELQRLRPLADEGRTYRADLVDQALREGVRAQGDGFPIETYRALLAGAPIDQVKQIRDSLKAKGDERFPGGRQTEDTAERSATNGTVPEIPAAAHKG